MAPFNDNIKFPMWNLNINDLTLINFHIPLITKRFFRFFDRHSDKTVSLSELLPNIKKFRNKILDFFQKVSRKWLLNCSSYCDTCLEPINFCNKCPPVNSSRSSFSTDRRIESTFLYTLTSLYQSIFRATSLYLPIYRSTSLYLPIFCTTSKYLQIFRTTSLHLPFSALPHYTYQFSVLPHYTFHFPHYLTIPTDSPQLCHYRFFSGGSRA